MVNFKQIQKIIDREVLKPLGGFLTLVEPSQTAATASKPHRGRKAGTTYTNIPAVETENKTEDGKGSIVYVVTGTTPKSIKAGWECIAFDGLTYRVSEVEQTNPNGAVRLVQRIVVER